MVLLNLLSRALGMILFSISVCYGMEGSIKIGSPSLFHDPYQQIHESDCLIKCYSLNGNKSLVSIYTGTYMTIPDTAQTFVLTTGHIAPNHYMSVSFNTGIEYEMVGYTSFIPKFIPGATYDASSHFLACLAGGDIGIGFIPSYDGIIKPAHFLPLAESDASRETTPQLRQDYLKNSKDIFCSLSGFGDAISTVWDDSYTIIRCNENHAQILMTLHVNPQVAFSNPPSKNRSYLEKNKGYIKKNLDTLLKDSSSYYFDAYYQKPHTLRATPYEQPLRQGFSGASLRTVEGYVIGVASAVERGILNDAATQESYALYYGRHMYDSAHYLCNKLYSYKPIIFMALLLNAYYAFDQQIIPAVVFSVLFVSMITYTLEKLHSFYSYGAVLPGARSFFSPTLLWEPLIIKYVNEYYAKS